MPELFLSVHTLGSSVADALATVFGGDTPATPLSLYQIAARAAIVYLIGIAAIRVGKSRSLSRVTSIDVLLGFILGSLLSRGITGHASLSGTAVGSVVLVAAHYALTAAACYSHRFGNLIKGHVRPLVDQGKVLKGNLRRSHLSEEDLWEELRLSGISDLSQVKAAYKERNGEVSVIRF
ncbi:MAG TPA: YetF domain-containing protein [Pirellulales bacterium]|nr:YetF domain-containing protein [Pirellulales bacterium]